MKPILAIFQTASVLIARAVRYLTPRAWRHDLLEVKLEGDIPEELPHTSILKRITGMKTPFRDYLLTLKEAKDDPNLKAAIFHIREPNIGWARAWELREIIKELRNCGLSTTAYLESGDNLSYYIAAACDEIFLAPSGQIRIRGLTGEAVFIKKLLDKVGIKAEFAHAGKYKTAQETFTRVTMSPAHREELNDILDNFYNFWISELASDRHIGEKRMKALVDKGSFLAEEARKSGLADKLCYRDEITDIYEERLGRRPRRVKLTRYLAFRTLDKPLSTFLKTGPAVALLYATGPITTGVSSDYAPTGRSTGSDSITESLRKLRENRNVAGIVLRINSPGGSALASDLIWRELTLSTAGMNPGDGADEKERKPVVVSMGDVAASGGYYISSCADKILAAPLTMTGSIGVFGGKFNVSGLAQTVGLHVETISRGKTADADSAFRAYTPAEKKRVQAEIRSAYKDFLNRVSRGRSLSAHKVEQVARGRVWLGSQALEKGLVDSAGGILSAIEEVKKRAGIPPEQKVPLETYPRKKRMLKLPLRGMSSRSRLRSLLAETALSLLPPEAQELYPLIREKGPLALMPYLLRIR